MQVKSQGHCLCLTCSELTRRSQSQSPTNPGTIVPAAASPPPPPAPAGPLPPAASAPLPSPPDRPGCHLQALDPWEGGRARTQTGPWVSAGSRPGGCGPWSAARDRAGPELHGDGNARPSHPHPRFPPGPTRTCPGQSAPAPRAPQLAVSWPRVGSPDSLRNVLKLGVRQEP